MFALHKQLHIYGFSDVTNLLSSAPGTALHWWCEELGNESRETQVTIKELKDFRSKLKYHVYFTYITSEFVNTVI